MRALLLLLVLAGCVTHDPLETEQACIKDRCFDVELAVSDYEKMQGLMHVDELPADSGMLFIYEDEGIRSFWMKNTLIPLDIVWIGSDLRIRHIARDVEPCEADPCPIYRPDVPAQYVLEVNAGEAAFDIKDSVVLR